MKPVVPNTPTPIMLEMTNAVALSNPSLRSSVGVEVTGIECTARALRPVALLVLLAATTRTRVITTHLWGRTVHDCIHRRPDAHRRFAVIVAFVVMSMSFV